MSGAQKLAQALAGHSLYHYLQRIFDVGDVRDLCEALPYRRFWIAQVKLAPWLGHS
jgi:hypothetical protein